MDELRLKRYRDKINYIFDKINLFTIKPRSELEKDGILYGIQTSIESLIDIIAMLIKDLGIPVKDDISNIDRIVKKIKINPELGEKLKKANHMRNLIVHRYNMIDENKIFNSIEDIRNLILEWLDIIEEVLENIDRY
ncbi:MAG: DUF86 domain-containing protein [Promethearchaeota archaeon]